MPGAYHGLKADYSISTKNGFARLSRMAGEDNRWPPPDSGNVNEDITLDAVYGGAADPNDPQEYVVYSVDWVDENPDEVEEIEELERVSGEPVEDFTRYLDENFEGWVYHHERGEVYVLNNNTDEGRSGQQTRRRN